MAGSSPPEASTSGRKHSGGFQLLPTFAIISAHPALQHVPLEALLPGGLDRVRGGAQGSAGGSAVAPSAPRAHALRSVRPHG
jgi:hypothetical protein